MKLHLLRDLPGTLGGVAAEPYQAGRDYEVPGDLAAVMLREGWASEARAVSAPAEEPAPADTGASGSDED